MGFRNSLILTGLGLLLAAYWIGDWAIWLGAPLLFMGIILKHLDLS